MRFQAWDSLQDSTDNSSIDKVETSLEWQEYSPHFQDTTDALPCHIYLPVCLWIMDPHSRAPKKKTSHGNEVLSQNTTHLIQRPCYQRGSSFQDPVKIRKLQWYGHVSRHSERGKKTRQTEEDVGRQHQGMDRPGVRQVPEGSGEQGKMEKTGC